MPIRPENADRYPKDWKDISLSIRRDRANWTCEMADCKAEQGQPHPLTGSNVVLTVAHLDNTPENCDPANLMALCQRCHLLLDIDLHRNNLRLNRRGTYVKGDGYQGVGKLF